ncbi:MAG: sodium-dependent transporter [Clostridia bacterium]|nr:sodium-dependent transporter [Clostridia bacterium]MBQ6529565.1 sodium-dependent transporter [Clostridia bacterium]
MENTNKRNSFGGTLGFVLAAAGSAVGLGNIWRFPYLAAKDGGGLFIFVYLILALTFGFTLLTTEIAIGRKTKQGPLTAYGKIKKGWGFLGPIATIVPFLIMPYYCVIGGWVLKYLVGFVSGGGAAMAGEGYFGAFISGGLMGGIWQPVIFFVIFLLMCAFVVIRGVNKGIESMSKIIMPVLLVLVIGIAIFSLTISHTTTNEAGEQITRTGLQGMAKYLIPDFSTITLKQLFVTVMDAMGQLFYSLSVAMGIMVAYGSYVKDDANLAKSINQIEIFDTVVAFLAGAMIIPAVYAISGPENMNAGPGLMFMTLPQVFMQMGIAGHIIGALFFIMVLFAALTSAISILEAVVASLMDKFGMKRTTAALAETGIALVLGIIVCFGYNLLMFDIKLPNGSEAQILDIMDYVSNQILMPILAIGTCILIGWVAKPKYAIDEVTKNGERFGRKGLYNVMIKFVAPALLFVLFIQALGVNFF